VVETVQDRRASFRGGCARPSKAGCGAEQYEVEQPASSLECMCLLRRRKGRKHGPEIQQLDVYKELCYSYVCS
jgi:hypothetical protein